MKVIRSTAFPFLILLCIINTFSVASNQKRIESFNLVETTIKNNADDKFDIEHRSSSQKVLSRQRRFLPEAFTAYFVTKSFVTIASFFGIVDLAIGLTDLGLGIHNNKEQDRLMVKLAENISSIMDSVEKINADLHTIVKPDLPVPTKTFQRRNLEDVITGKSDIPLNDYELNMLDSILDAARTTRFKVEKQIYKHRMVRYQIISVSNSSNRLEIRHHEEWNRFNSTQVQMMSDNSEWLTRTKQKTSNQHWYIDDDGNIRSILNDFCLEGQ